MPKAPAADPREEYIERHSRAAMHSVALTPKGIEDLKFFRKKADEGRPITWKGLREYFRAHHAIEVGRTRLATLAVQAGIDPWWSSSRG